MISAPPVSFDSRLETGQLGEGEIARWFIGRGFRVLPAYQIEVNHGKGPRLFTAEGQFISPDLLIFNADKVLWIEAKTKSAFTWHRISNSFQTGIDRRHWLHYIEVEKLTPFPVWILFLHRAGNVAKDTPAGMQSPSGLFGNTIPKLTTSIHHESDKWGPSGMVYWRLESLIKIANDSLPSIHRQDRSPIPPASVRPLSVPEIMAATGTEQQHATSGQDQRYAHDRQQ